MINAVEKLPHIAFQEISLASMLFEMLMHKFVQPIHGKQRALVLSTRCIIINQMVFKVWSQQIVA